MGLQMPDDKESWPSAARGQWVNDICPSCKSGIFLDSAEAVDVACSMARVSGHAGTDRPVASICSILHGNIIVVIS